MTKGRLAGSWIALVALAVIVSHGRVARAEEPAQVLESGLVAMVPGEELNIRSRVSGSTSWRVVVSFHDQADNLLASSIQTAQPGHPAHARIGYAQLPGAGAVRLVHVSTQATPMGECPGLATDDALTVMADAVQNNAAIRAVEQCRRDTGPITCSAAINLISCYQP